MDFVQLDQRLDRGENVLVTYKYPVSVSTASSGVTYQTRTDRLLAVEPSNGRVFVSFKGKLPVWIEADEVLDIKASI